MKSQLSVKVNQCMMPGNWYGFYIGSEFLVIEAELVFQKPECVHKVYKVVDGPGCGDLILPSDCEVIK